VFKHKHKKMVLNKAFVQTYRITNACFGFF